MPPLTPFEDDFNENEMFGAGAGIKQPPRMALPKNQTFSPPEFTAPSAPSPLKPLLAEPEEAPTNPNPLSGYFRVPGVHIKLPTGGAFLPPGEYTPTMGEDIPVYPMRAADELLLKSPDALMSGHALVSLIKSCVPAIADPKKISTPDLDVVLLGIRAATYGEMMDIDVICPACSQENSFQVNLGALLSTMTFVEPENPVRMDDNVVVYVKPYTMEIATRVAMATYEETRTMMSSEDLPPEQKAEVMNACYDRLNTLNMRALSSSVLRVVIPGSVVTDPKYIAEFVGETNRNWTRKIEDKMTELNKKGIDKDIEAHCSKCQHEWTANIEFDPSSFFDTGS